MNSENSGRLFGMLLCAPLSVLGFLLGLHVLEPSIMSGWCTSRRGCGAIK
jgi:hypothetical protein